ncbi:hypothetical protein B0H14DRAFT_2618859 [Mycena olivaceomarginata]|nr:hypothetical protein B0H14DRAFT_2618859 [Mycena olivaceomarginata]
MSSHGFIAPRTVAQAVAIPPLLFVLLENFRGGGLRPELPSTFAHVVRSAIPSTVCGPDDMPFGRIAELEKYVVAYLERAALLYTISFEVSRRTGQPMKLDPLVYWCLSQAITFDYFLGKPTYGYVPDARESFLSRINLAANLANKARGPSSALDVQLTPDFASLPQVPSWSRSRISTLESLQLINNWACKNALLEDGIEQTQNFRRALEKSATYADMGWFLQYEVAYVGLVFFCPKVRSPHALFICSHGGGPSCCCYPGLRDKGPPSDSVVPNSSSSGSIRRAILAQDLHHTTHITVEEETPEETVGLIRDAVSVLLKNMVALGKAILKYGSFGDASAAGYFVPPEGTTLFGMAERFVDLYGYHGDTSPFDRALMFDNLNTLFRTMVLDEEYLRFGIDFPNFDVSKEDLERNQGPWCTNLEIAYCDTIRNWGMGLGTNFLTRRESTPLRGRTQPMTREAVISCPNHRRREVSSPHDHGASEIRQLLIRPPGPHVSSISRFLPLLNALSLEDKTLELVRWRPSEGWAAFLEFRLRPMVYFVHAAVTHDFTLIGAKGGYSLVELDHIKYWRLLLSSRCAVRSVYMDDVCIRYPPVVGLPEEATAMFEIMHRVCHSVGYPFSQESWILNLDLLIPLVESARETRALLRTAFDYPAFDKHGQLLIPDFYSVEALPQDVSLERNNRGHPVSTR